MTQEKPIRKIIWAIDPFIEEKALQRSAGMVIQALTENSPADIFPIYIWSVYPAPLQFDLPSNYGQQVKRNARKSLKALVSRMKLSRLKPITVITGSYLPVKDGVEEVMSFSKKQKADLIVVSTHARKGSKRWMMGSFAETLMLNSDIPILVVNPHLKGKPNLGEILFPTDFSDESKEAFEKVIELARIKGSHITLFHKVSYPVTPGIEPAFSAYPYQSDLFHKAIEAKRSDASLWADEAQSNQIELDTCIDLKMGSSAADAILKFSKKKPGMIAMASHSGPFRRMLLGSTTRKVVRGAECPVWILHPKRKVQDIENY
jgi:nucleotide-binding universal stress UspA family protein